MKCLMKYQWVKLPRNHLPEGKGVMGAWAKLASRAAFRKGQASYCGHINAVRPGMCSAISIRGNVLPEQNRNGSTMGLCSGLSWICREDI